MAANGTVQIRSFRVCFQLERRLHRIDSYRIPLPYGIPLSGIAYSAGTLVAVLFLSRLPILGAAIDLLPWSMRYVALPILGAYALVRSKIDGRPPLTAGAAALRYLLSPRRLCAFRPAPALGTARFGPVTLAPGDCVGRYRPGFVVGPAEVVLRYPASLESRRRVLMLRAGDGGPLWRGKQVNLRRGQRLVIR